jgi:hypothetical protein
MTYVVLNNELELMATHARLQCREFLTEQVKSIFETHPTYEKLVMSLSGAYFIRLTPTGDKEMLWFDDVTELASEFGEEHPLVQFVDKWVEKDGVFAWRLFYSHPYEVTR